MPNRRIGPGRAAERRGGVRRSFDVHDDPAILGNQRITRDEPQWLDDGLGDQQAVKRVFVNGRQLLDLQDMSRLDRQMGIAGIFERLQGLRR